MQIIMQANLSKEDILQAIADYAAKETGREVNVDSIALSRGDIEATISFDDKPEKLKGKAKRAPKKDAWTDKVSIKTEESEETGVEANKEVIAETITEEVQEEIQEEQAEEPAPVPKKTGSIFNFASEAS
jgi:hypothetical protein